MGSIHDKTEEKQNATEKNAGQDIVHAIRLRLSLPWRKQWIKVFHRAAGY